LTLVARAALLGAQCAKRIDFQALDGAFEERRTLRGRDAAGSRFDARVQEASRIVAQRRLAKVRDGAKKTIQRR
jgi:hypothetical protein